MIRITDIIDKIYDYYPDADIDIVDRAYIYSAKVHDGQLRLSGEPYLSHPLEVASLLADMRLDTTSIACGLLHDVVEDTHATIEDIQKMFGTEAAKIIEGVTKISSLSFNTAKARQAGNIRKMILAMADDIREVKSTIQDILNHANLSCTVTGRYKQFYSIYQKMLAQNLEFEEVYDIIAFRVILDTIPQCYEALGLIHSKWRPIPYKFKDYIGFPKPNGYKSLHTTVVGPYAERMEIQIRTREMEQVANSGIAAHWSYKEGKTIDEETKSTFAWIQNLVEHEDSYGDPEEFLENVRIDLFPKDIYVFTPNGEVKNLPKGSTPVDFAYMIHTEVGHQCSGAKVNGRIVPLQYKLQTGDIVEITTFKGHHPSPDWLQYVKTGKARARIRHWIKKQETDRSISLGRELCEKAFRKHKLNFNEMVHSKQMEQAAKDLNFKNVDDLIAHIGYGKITPLQLMGKLVPDVKPKKEDTLFTKLMPRRKDKKTSDADAIIVDGLDDILIRFGQCCQPVPGDRITGYITHGAGITVHRKGCVNALKMNPERQIRVQWKDKATGPFPVKMNIRAYDKVGLLAELSSVLSQQEANIVDVNLESAKDKMVNGSFTITIKGIDHLDNVIAKLKQIDTIQEISRA